MGNFRPEDQTSLAAQGILVRDPHGRVEGSFGISRPARRQPTKSAPAQFVTGATEQLADTAINLPDVIINDLLRPFMPPDLQNLDRSAAPNIDIMPTGREAFAGIDTLFNDKSFLENLGAREQDAADRPIATGFGHATGDALTLLGLRGATRGGFERAGQKLSRPRGRLHEVATAGPRSFKRGVAQGVDNSIQWLTNTFARSAEAGLEGAALAVLKGGDPIETAAMTASLQGAGSLGIALTDLVPKNIVGKNIGLPLRMAITAAATGSMLELAESFIPGIGDDQFNFEGAFDKMVIGLGVGAGLRAAGFSRVKDTGFTKLTEDAFTVIPRGKWISLVEDLMTEQQRGNLLPRQVNDMMARAPDKFPPKTLKQLQDAQIRGNFVQVVTELSEELEPLANVPDPRLSGVPLKEER